MVGSYFGYTVNSLKSQLIVKEASKIKALRLFEGTAVAIVDGCRVIGSVIGSKETYENTNLSTAKNIPIC